MSERCRLWMHAIAVIAVAAVLLIVGKGDWFVQWENIEAPVTPTTRDIRAVKGAIRDHHKMIGTYPEGNNAAVMKAILGANSKQIVFIELPKESLNRFGEIIDSMGTPYEIRVTSSGDVSMRTAGADRLFGNSHDKDSRSK